MDLDYIGGFIDAEGYVHRNYHRPSFAVRISNTNSTILYAIQQFLNRGCIYKVNRKKPVRLPSGKLALNTKLEYRLEIGATKDFASLLFPHIFLKRKLLSSAFNLDIPFQISWSYIAGFFDGDGSLSFNGKTSWYFSIIEPNRELLELMREFIGEGYVYPHGKNCLFLRISKRQVLQNIGKKLLPYCILKKEKILQMFAYFNTHEWHSNYKMKDVTKKTLEDLYTVERLSIRKIASKFHVKYNPMREKLLKFSIPLRPLGTNRYSNGLRSDFIVVSKVEA